ncbi:MAG: DUF5703 domain-containing protein [Cephaloticoccus sp.]|nr:DUF5703 domain-containing protein [Cephaloticoccus sp.]MCF7759848.1 DUF5703 domain-containing protein [Cephaloticoccus sp.]
MPLGNGDIAANVWTEPSGDILLYLAKNDAWDHLGRLIKIGRLRIRIKPDLLSEGNFSQTLSLADAAVTLTNGNVTIRLWCDAHWPRMVVEVKSNEPCEVRVDLDAWRTAASPVDGAEVYAPNGLDREKFNLVAQPDKLVPKLRNAVAWYQRNETSIWPHVLNLQSLSAAKETVSDPLLHRTFGGLMQGKDFKGKGRTGLVTARKTTATEFSVTVLCAQTKSVDDWVSQIQANSNPKSVPSVAEAWRDHQAWWENFWGRSHIRIECRGPDWGNAEQITQQATWHRFMVACCGRGQFPIKFNGALFTADWGLKNEDFDADYRRWGGGYWWQNTRLIYWSMLANGDYDLMRPLFRMYRDMLPLAELRTQVWFGHGGVFFPETQYFWGTHLPSNYGWDRTGKEPGDVENQYIRRYWVSGFELIALMLENYQHTGDSSLLEQELLPIARAVLKFYALHYPNDSAGRLFLSPAQSLETWWDAENPMPEIAALHFLLPQLLALPDENLQVSDLGAWRALSARLPELPKGTRDGQRQLLAAARHESVPKNSENPELYAVFPFKLFGIGHADLDMAQRTFTKRVFPDTGGWRQDAIQAAYLGLTETAAFYVTKNFTEGTCTQARFKGFWGPNYDWVPDFDHGSVAQIALQSMLVQTVGKRIYLFPAWPAGRWNVSFRLHLSRQTDITCELKDGKIERLEITPPGRRHDIVVLLNQDKSQAVDLPGSFTSA